MSLEKLTLSLWEAPQPIRKTGFDPVPCIYWDLTECLVAGSAPGNVGTGHTGLLPGAY